MMGNAREFSSSEVRHYCAERLPGLKLRGSEWRGPCPIHDGKNDSFSVNAESGTWYCHSKCGRGGTLIQLEAELSGSNHAEARAVALQLVGRGQSAKIRRTPSAIYDYEDEKGTLLFQCVRYEPKAFSQRRPDGRGGHINNLKGVRRVLFRLPTLVSASEVLVVEGEKDVASLVRLGFVATCNPMGAGKWRPEYSEQLAGKHVVIFPDNDETGKGHATAVGTSLQGKSASVRIASVPVGKDVSEWIDQGATGTHIKDAIQAARPLGGANERSDNWKERLLTNQWGTVKSILANAITALRRAPEWDGVLGFNEFSQATEARKAPPWTNGKTGEWTDDHDRLAADWLQHQSIFVSVEIAGLAIQTVAKERCFHPVRDYLDSLKWDGTLRLDNWPSLYLGCEPSEYISAVGSRWMIAAVARIYEPGVKADCALILEGPQGLLKSTVLRTLAGKWFTDDIAELGSKDAAMQARGVWIIEIPELDAMSRVDVAKIKAFISRTTDRFRPPYGKRLVESPRQCVFAGSVNHSAYLRDETGGRRFWPVACERILIEELQRDRDQLWAEAFARYRAGERWWLDTKELELAAQQEQASRYESDPWEDLVAAWIEGRESVSIEELLCQCLDKPKANWAQSDKNRLARCLTALGWERCKMGPRAGRQWRYRPSERDRVPVVTQSVSQSGVATGPPNAFQNQDSLDSVPVSQLKSRARVGSVDPLVDELGEIFKTQYVTGTPGHLDREGIPS
jgi:predicted P-loop ATPase